MHGNLQLIMHGRMQAVSNSFVSDAPLAYMLRPKRCKGHHGMHAICINPPPECLFSRQSKACLTTLIYPLNKLRSQSDMQVWVPL